MLPRPEPLHADGEEFVEAHDYRRLGAAILLAALEDLRDRSPRIRASAQRFFYSNRLPQLRVRQWVLGLCNLTQADLDQLLDRIKPKENR